MDATPIIIKVDLLIAVYNAESLPGLVDKVAGRGHPGCEAQLGVRLRIFLCPVLRCVARPVNA